MIGSVLGHYRILEQIGAGGMGVVYRARDERLERDVALKVLPAGTLTDETARRRFRKEALALSQLNHPNIASVHDYDTHRGIDFLVMELISGVTLEEKLHDGPLLEKEIGRLGAQLAQGLAAAHEHGVIHRDLKPGNLRLTPDGRMKVLDFGLATLARPRTESATTVTAAETGVAGTLPYMSPEQLRGEKADARSDIFSAGVVLYEMATGRRPFARPADTLLHPPPAPSELNRLVSPALELILLKALDKEPDLRYQSARELEVDLERLMAPAVVAAPRKRRRHWAVAAALVLLLAAATSFFEYRRATLALDSVAVLPFLNASGSADADYLSDGITEALIDSLARLPRLTVISRSTAFRYKGKEADPQAVGRELKVRAVLLGRLAQRGENLTVSAELVDTRKGRRLWGGQYKRKLVDLLAIQAELSGEISDNLRLRLTGEQRQALARRHTQRPEAYQEYLKGLYFFNKKTAVAFQTAIEHFNRATALDPSYAQAYAALAECYYLLPLFGGLPARETEPKLRAAANKAIQLDDTLPEAHVAQAIYKEGAEWDWADAQKHYRRAIELNPACANAHFRFGANLIAVGRCDDAIAEIRRALELDPVSVAFSNVLGLAYHYGRRYDEAIQQYRKTLAMDPAFASGHLYLGEVYLAQSRYPEALAEVKEAARLMRDAPRAVSTLALAYALSGDRAAARKLLDQMLAQRARRGYPAAAIVHAHIGLGDKNRALEWLEIAVEERDLAVAFLKVNPVFDPLRSDPRFTQLLRKINVAP